MNSRAQRRGQAQTKASVMTPGTESSAEGDPRPYAALLSLVSGGTRCRQVEARPSQGTPARPQPAVDADTR
jgi:hypothetical protein